MGLLSKGDTNAKLSKNAKYDWKSYILYLAPFTQNSKGVNLCPNASPQCADACLFTAGRGAFSNVASARVKKTEYFLANRRAFVDELIRELRKIKGRASVRLNGTSDIDWLKMCKAYGYDLLEMFPDLQFYDYTKSLHRWLKYRGTNYHLTFSRSEVNESECAEVLRLGGNVAVVFDELPTEWMGYRVVNGDESDLRFLDDSNVVVGLKAKGKARKETSGFVVRSVSSSVVVG